jgi:ketosteroid isomerase-like protein
MLQENVEVVRAIFERWNAGDRTVATEDLDPALEVETPFSYRQEQGPRSGLSQGVGDVAGER